VYLFFNALLFLELDVALLQLAPLLGSARLFLLLVLQLRLLRLVRLGALAQLLVLLDLLATRQNPLVVVLLVIAVYSRVVLQLKRETNITCVNCKTSGLKYQNCNSMVKYNR
jgi:hypothetical protein